MLEGSVGKVARSLCAGADGAGLAVVSDKESESGPGVFAEYQGLSLVLSPVSGCRVIVVRPEYPETEVVGVRDVDAAIESEDPLFVFGPARMSVGRRFQG